MRFELILESLCCDTLTQDHDWQTGNLSLEALQLQKLLMLEVVTYNIEIQDIANSRLLRYKLGLL